MGISLPIGSHLDDAQARRTTRQAEDYFSTAGRRAGDEFSRQVNQGLGKIDTAKARAQAAQLERGYAKAADAAGKLRTEEEKLKAVNALSNATDAQKIAAAERVEKARRAESRAVRELTNDMRELRNAGLVAVQAGDGLQIMGNSATKASMELADLGASGGRLLTVLGPAGIATAAVGAVEAISTLGSAAVELSGVLGLIPGMVVAAGAAFGTMKVATLGFGDALGDVGKALQDFHNPKAFGEDQKNFAEDLQALSPNAQQAALAINAMIPAFDRLKMSTQDALFAGVGQELNRLASTYLPSIQTMMASVAGSFNSMFKGVANQLMTPETQQQIQQMLQNISQAFQNLAPAMGPVTKAFAELANVSTSFLPGLATSVANAATEFSNFITKAAESGQLREWIQDGINAVKELASAVPPLIDSFKVFFGNGKESVDTVKDSILLLAGTLKLLKGDIDGFKDVWPSFGDAAVKVFNDINSSINNLLIAPINFAIDAINKISGLLPTGSANTPHIPKLGMGTTLPSDSSAPPGFSGGGGSFDSTPGFSGGGGHFGTPTTGGYSRIPGMHLATGVSAWWPTVPGLPADDSKGKKQALPTVPYGNQDPMSLLQGFPATASLYGAAGTVLDNQQKVAQAKSDLNTLEKANVRDEDAITAKRNELARAQREEHESELRLTEAKQQAVQKSLKGMQTASGELQQLGVELDKDFGISKGLGGIIENAVKALGNILAAPFLQALGFVAKANPNEGSGLVGIAAANGAFGSQYTPGAIAMMQASQRGGGNSFVGLPGTRGGQPYGLPAGTDTGGYGSSGPAFPQWVHNLEQAFGVKASTYAGHQESDRNEPGYAPNPMHQNRGIDWSGSPEAMQRFATYMASQPNAEQVIYQNPLTGQATEAVAGQARPGYFADQLSGHQKHVHTRQAYSIGEQGLPQGADQATGSLNSLASAANSAASALGGGLSTQQWNNIAGAEASGNWQANTGNGFYGGLQIVPSTWNAFGGPQYAPRADLASPEQQMAVGNNILAGQGPGAWPATSAAHPEWFQPGVGIPASMGPGGGGMMPGMGPPQGLPGVGLGNVYPSQGGNSGNILGGMAMDGIMAATSGLDMLAPGAGAAAKIGIQIANRTIGYAAQNAGILANGVGEFFSVGDNPKGSIGAGWLGKLAGGIAGAAPALPNLAAKKAPEQPAGGQQQGGGNTYGDTNINVTAREGASGQEHGEQIAAEQGRMWSPAGRQ